MDERTIQFSCDLFWGYRVEIDINPLNSIEEVVEKSIANLTDFLIKNNLIVLKEKLEKKKYYIHDMTWFDILQNSDHKVYVCCHNEE